MSALRLSCAALLAASLFAAPSHAGITLQVTIRGEVEFNGISSGTLGGVANGESATMRFKLDSDTFTNGPGFPTRGYHIVPASFRMAFDSGVIGLQSPFPAGETPMFSLRNDDPAVDGFMVTTQPDFPLGVPTNQAGGFGQFVDNWYVTYGGDTLPSLDILDALGSYGFTGLTVFNWTMVDGPFDAMGLIFESMTIEVDGSAWSDIGSALAGVDGDPRLIGTGDLSDGSANSVELAHAAPGALTGLFLALGPTTPVPFKGGTLQPVPLLIEPILLPSSPTGTLSLPFVMPAGLPAGAELVVQMAIQDGAAIHGVALSNAIRGVTP
ncbi:MAG: hypothetical protein DRQ55_04975 [Planctomycetota bacterium]|nr:MAG: hypothetical protein DRQ55_04975 [Planctomycetota bacterium]